MALKPAEGRLAGRRQIGERFPRARSASSWHERPPREVWPPSQSEKRAGLTDTLVLARMARIAERWVLAPSLSCYNPAERVAVLPFSPPTRNPMSHTLTLELDDEIYTTIRRQAEAAGISPIDWALRAIERYRTGFAEAPTESTSESEDRDGGQLETRIDELYDQLRTLVARSAHEPGLRGEIGEKRRQLVALQEEEARLAERRARSRLRIQPGEGYRMLERVEKLLET